jgi:hypothetical protein
MQPASPLQVFTHQQFCQLAAAPPACAVLITGIQSPQDGPGVLAQLRAWGWSTEEEATLLATDPAQSPPRQIRLEQLAELGQSGGGKFAPCQLYLNPRPDPTWVALQGLIEVVAQLRNPEGGCPWDLAQTPTSLMPYVIEEAYEGAA